MNRTQYQYSCEIAKFSKIISFNSFIRLFVISLYVLLCPSWSILVFLFIPLFHLVLINDHLFNWPLSDRPRSDLLSSFEKAALVVPASLLFNFYHYLSYLIAILFLVISLFLKTAPFPLDSDTSPVLLEWKVKMK